MSDNMGGLPLTVAVSADDWAFTKRRLRYLEAVIFQILGDRGTVREWYTAAELAGFALRGLPRSKQGVLRLAHAEFWRRRVGTGRGGERYEFHCTGLPERAFHDLLDRILGLPTEGAEDDTPAAPVPKVAQADAPPAALPANTAPSWVLPLLRVMRTQDAPSLPLALAALPQRLPAGVRCPSPDEAERVLRELGFVA